MLSHIFNFSDEGDQLFITKANCVAMCHHAVIYLAIILFFSIAITVTLNTVHSNSNKLKIMFNISKILNITLSIFLFLLIFIKFFLSVFYLKEYTANMSSKTYETVQLKYLFPGLTFTVNSSVLSDAVVLLAFSSGSVCIYMLGEKNMVKFLSNGSIFSFFYLAVTLMVYTTNLLVMFIGFECLFLPTLYFAYSHVYVMRADRTITILLHWTLCGAFMVLSVIAYIYFKYKTLEFYKLCDTTFTDIENVGLYLLVFIGFGVKVPVFPFHYWLTKIHVEAPAGFSIFLSGFLVKAAVYCFYVFNITISSIFAKQIMVTVIVLGVLESSVKMWTVTDFKKLIAFATVQEMNLILFVLLASSNMTHFAVVFFILVHGWLSTLMFFLVDVIQRKSLSRNITTISGLAYTFPAIRFPIWLVIILFSGFPLTAKFSIEWQVLAVLVSQSQYVMFVVFFIALVLGTIGFAKQMFIILYGLPRKELKINNTLSRKDKYLLYFICGLLIFLNLLHLFLS